ncbi:nuclear transport factor 2 family protein [Naasia lichenicola]|uniref:Nuclear transport factor 2 family protein n=1 Tax=Naasia lichenicola TaxID=2565933 RepID=A0A4S4FGD7_9MICO|nr:nuclear transport factor 2 family protein [Naasia lichenicola]THG28126.1 nuclear transport factor 2 family protein [Naasia lichenicola]
MTLMTSTLDSVIVVWHVAVNAGDAETAASACTEDVVMRGPQGSSHGRDSMRDWVSQAGIRLMPKEAYDVPGGIVVAQEATWPGAANWDASTPPSRLYTAFALRDGSIAGVFRFESLEEARSYPIAA